MRKLWLPTLGLIAGLAALGLNFGPGLGSGLGLNLGKPKTPNEASDKPKGPPRVSIDDGGCRINQTKVSCARLPSKLSKQRSGKVLLHVAPSARHLQVRSTVEVLKKAGFQAVVVPD